MGNNEKDNIFAVQIDMQRTTDFRFGLAAVLSIQFQ